ncbi:MAG: penicillin-binding protein 2 [Dehalococcoidia bacterium]
MSTRPADEDGGTLRLWLLCGVSVVLLVVLGIQAVRMQVLDPAVPATIREGFPRVLPVEAPRGLITDRDGVVLARNLPRYRVGIIPGALPEESASRRELLIRIATVTRVPYAELEEAAAGHLATVDPFAPVTVRDDLTVDDAIRIRAALAGTGAIFVQTSAARRYEPSGALGHVLGYVGALPEDEAESLAAAGYQLDSRIGRAGVETQYETALRGEPGRRLVLAHPTGRILRELGTEAPTPGSNLVLSVDLDLQRDVEAALRRGIGNGGDVIKYHAARETPSATSGAAIVLDVHTGETLAMVSLPSYDANLFNGDADSEQIAATFEDPMRPLVDRTYMEVRSPGSIFKPLMALAALEEGVATPETRIVSTGALTVRSEYDGSTYVFRDWAAHGNIDMTAAIARSSNVYFYMLAGGYREGGIETFRGLGPDAMARWSRAAGLGSPTGLDLPGERTGLVPDPAWKQREVGDAWVLGDTYTYGIGQGYLTATPMQMAVLAAAIANGGDVLTPHVVRGLERDGTTTPIETQVAGRLPASEAHLTFVRDALISAAEPWGTANTGAPDDVLIGGKTGTAEFGQPYPDGSYDTHGWYMGFGPAEDPEIAVVVYLEYGVGQTHAGPVAREIFEAYFGTDEPAQPDRVAR